MVDWNERYQAGDMPWEKGAAAQPLLELLAKIPPPAWGEGQILVPGCGYGHDVRALADAGLNPVGVDLSELAVEKARGFPPAGGETYELGDFLDPAWRKGRRFSAIWEHTCFCAIDPARRADYAASAAELLSPGGLLAGVFFLTPFDPGEASAGPPFATTIRELDDRFSPNFGRVDGWVPRQAYPGREGREWIGIYRKI